MRVKRTFLLLIGVLLLAVSVIVLDYVFSDRLHGRVTEIQEDGRIHILGQNQRDYQIAVNVRMPTSKEFEIGDELTVWLKRGATNAMSPGEGRAKLFYIKHKKKGSP